MREAQRWHASRHRGPALTNAADSARAHCPKTKPGIRAGGDRPQQPLVHAQPRRVRRLVQSSAVGAETRAGALALGGAARHLSRTRGHRAFARTVPAGKRAGGPQTQSRRVARGSRTRGPAPPKKEHRAWPPTPKHSPLPQLSLSHGMLSTVATVSTRTSASPPGRVARRQVRLQAACRVAGQPPPGEGVGSQGA
jgi:hypothetical protein